MNAKRPSTQQIDPHSKCSQFISIVVGTQSSVQKGHPHNKLTPCSRCSQFTWMVVEAHTIDPMQQMQPIYMNGGGDPVISAELTFKLFSEGNCGQYFHLNDTHASWLLHCHFFWMDGHTFGFLDLRRLEYIWCQITGRTCKFAYVQFCFQIQNHKINDKQQTDWPSKLIGLFFHFLGLFCSQRRILHCEKNILCITINGCKLFCWPNSQNTNPITGLGSKQDRKSERTQNKNKCAFLLTLTYAFNLGFS